jgi:hypothetical protein
LPHNCGVNLARLLMAAILACVTVVPWAWMGCSGGNPLPVQSFDGSGPSRDATVCMGGGLACFRANDCCSMLCVGGACASPSPPAPMLVCDEDSGTYLGHRPVQGDPCTPDGLACEFGESPFVLCDTVARCEDGGWTVSAPDLSDPACAPAASSCPPSLDAAPGSTPCAPTDIHCDYADRRCECAQNARMPGWPAHWTCQPPQPSDSMGRQLCPVTRPRLGTLCAALSTVCDYGACEVHGANRQECVSATATGTDYGRWADRPVECTCPAVAPSEGTGCSRLLQYCEYGTSNLPICDTVANCNPPMTWTLPWGPFSGHWYISTPEGGPPCAAAASGACPTAGPPVQGTICNATSLDCDYADRRCECAKGVTPQSPSTWRCTDPLLAGPGCGPRPRLGSPCPQDGVVCNYGACELAGGSAQECQGGAWTPVNAELCLMAACPANLPAAGSMCAAIVDPNAVLASAPSTRRLGAPCEYGTSHVSVCDTFATCPFALDGGPPPIASVWPDAGLRPGLRPLFEVVGNWAVGGPDGGALCQVPDQHLCPASFDTVPRGADCTGEPAFCDYPQGRCRCASPAGSATPTWSCQDPAPLCPRPRPRLGTACIKEGLVCAYGSCGALDSDIQICQQGQWSPIAIDCSLDAALLYGPADAPFE